MAKIDVVILSDAKTDFHRLLTETAVDTVLASEEKDFFNVIVIETQKNVNYNGTTTMSLNEKFNYNKFMNIGASKGEAKYIAFCNNDLVFEKDWAKNIIEAIEHRRIDCASPYSRSSRKHKFINPKGQVYTGTENGLHLAGWCFVMPRKNWEKIGGLDEDFSFWCADNATIEQLLIHGMNCALVTSSFVEHVGEGENTLSTLSKEEKEPMTFALVKKFNNKYDRNLFNIGK